MAARIGPQMAHFYGIGVIEIPAAYPGDFCRDRAA
jgi:hypothetical protein